MIRFWCRLLFHVCRLADIQIQRTTNRQVRHSSKTKQKKPIHSFIHSSSDRSPSHQTYASATFNYFFPIRIQRSITITTTIVTTTNLLAGELWPYEGQDRCIQMMKYFFLAPPRPERIRSVGPGLLLFRVVRYVRTTLLCSSACMYCTVQHTYCTIFDR